MGVRNRYPLAINENLEWSTILTGVAGMSYQELVSSSVSDYYVINNIKMIHDSIDTVPHRVIIQFAIYDDSNYYVFLERLNDRNDKPGRWYGTPPTETHVPGYEAITSIIQSNGSGPLIVLEHGWSIWCRSLANFGTEKLIVTATGGKY